MDIHRYLLALAEKSPNTTAAGHFLVRFDPHDDALHLNCATPASAEAVTGDDIAALVEAFAVRRRTPRLEFLAEAAPELEGALVAHGFTVEGSLPLMTLSAASLRTLAVPSDIELIFPNSEDELFAFAGAQKAAFGASAPANAHDVRRLRRTLDGGGVALGARSRATRETVGGALYTAPLEGIAELAGIGVIDRERRRGIGAALCSRLSAEAFARGVRHPFLMAAHEADERIYARVGFVTVSRVVSVSRALG
jgi:GNAT superfamily N-acetyltransferase